MAVALILCKKLKTELNFACKSEYIVLSSFLKVIKKTGKKLLKTEYSFSK